MKKILVIVVTMVFKSGLFAQEASILNVLEDQVDAFNTADVDRLVANVSKDFKWYYLTSDTLLLEVDGQDNFRTSMEGYFKAVSTVQSSINSYVVNGNRISFEEQVSYQNKAGELVRSTALGIYEIKNDKITRAWYFID